MDKQFMHCLRYIVQAFSTKNSTWNLVWSFWHVFIIVWIAWHFLKRIYKVHIFRSKLVKSGPVEYKFDLKSSMLGWVYDDNLYCRHLSLKPDVAYCGLSWCVKYVYFFLYFHEQHRWSINSTWNLVLLRSLFSLSLLVNN